MSAKPVMAQNVFGCICGLYTGFLSLCFENVSHVFSTECTIGMVEGDLK